MVRIRLRRIGSKGKALYKIIVADQRSPQKGKYIEEVGTYDPRHQRNTKGRKSHFRKSCRTQL